MGPGDELFRTAGSKLNEHPQYRYLIVFGCGSGYNCSPSPSRNGPLASGVTSIVVFGPFTIANGVPSCQPGE